jgi:hypothetical protein
MEQPEPVGQGPKGGSTTERHDDERRRRKSVVKQWRNAGGRRGRWTALWLGPVWPAEGQMCAATTGRKWEWLGARAHLNG